MRELPRMRIHLRADARVLWDEDEVAIKILDELSDVACIWQDGPMPADSDLKDLATEKKT